MVISLLCFKSIHRLNFPNTILNQGPKARTFCTKNLVSFIICCWETFTFSVFIFSDVDVPKPDEKSIITYVSSLYDVFPDVPSVEQSLKDNVSISLIHVQERGHQLCYKPRILLRSQREPVYFMNDLKSCTSPFWQCAVLLNSTIVFLLLQFHNWGQFLLISMNLVTLKLLWCVIYGLFVVFDFMMRFIWYTMKHSVDMGE